MIFLKILQKLENILKGLIANGVKLWTTDGVKNYYPIVYHRFIGLRIIVSFDAFSTILILANLSSPIFPLSFLKFILIPFFCHFFLFGPTITLCPFRLTKIHQYLFIHTPFPRHSINLAISPFSIPFLILSQSLLQFFSYLIPISL